MIETQRNSIISSKCGMCVSILLNRGVYIFSSGVTDSYIVEYFSLVTAVALHSEVTLS